MASLLGFLGALGDSVSNDGSQSYLTRLNNASDPEASLQRQAASQQAQAQSALSSYQGNNPLEILQMQAKTNPEIAAKLLAYQVAQNAALKPDWKMQEVDGSLVRYDANDPEGKVETVFGGGLGGKKNETMVKGEGDLRKEFDGLSKDYRVVQDAYNKIRNTAQDPSAAGDLSLIFSYMKILDPASTVREGEFANAQNAAGVPTQIQNLWNRAKTGERLAPEQRDDFLRQSENLYNAQATTYDSSVGKYRELATEYGYSPDRIVKPTVRGDGKPPVDKTALLKKIEELKKQKGVQ